MARARRFVPFWSTKKRGAPLVAGLRVYRELLQNRPLSRLLLGEFVSGIGDWLYIIAIFVVIYRQSGDAALVGAFGGIRLLPYVILSVPAGIVADRFDRRMVLLVSDLFRGALMAGLASLSMRRPAAGGGGGGSGSLGGPAFLAAIGRLPRRAGGGSGISPASR